MYEINAHVVQLRGVRSRIHVESTVDGQQVTVRPETIDVPRSDGHSGCKRRLIERGEHCSGDQRDKFDVIPFV